MYTLRIGYRRKADGSAEPICEPAVDAFLLNLWKHAAAARIPEGCAQYVVTAEVGETRARIEGHLSPDDVKDDVTRMMREGIIAMRATLRAIDQTYPVATFAKFAVDQAGLRLFFHPDKLVVTIKPPVPHPTGIGFEAPTVRLDGERTTVAITGHPQNHPVASWADTVICERVHVAILGRLTGLSALGGGTES